jgi:hypothetical protein
MHLYFFYHFLLCFGLMAFMAVVRHVSQFSTLQIINMKNVGHANASRQNISQCINIREPHTETHALSQAMDYYGGERVNHADFIRCPQHLIVQTSYYEARNLPCTKPASGSLLFECLIILCQLWLRRAERVWSTFRSRRCAMRNSTPTAPSIIK